MTNSWNVISPSPSTTAYDTTNIISSGINGRAKIGAPVAEYQFTAFDMSTYAGQHVQVRLMFRSNQYSGATGVYVDEIRLDEESSDPDGDGIVGILHEWSTVFSDPFVADTDGDRVSDGAD